MTANNEEIEYFMCDDCGWTGEPDELVDENDSGKFDQCPRCGSTSLTHDMETVDDV